MGLREGKQRRHKREHLRNQVVLGGEGEGIQHSVWASCREKTTWKKIQQETGEKRYKEVRCADEYGSMAGRRDDDSGPLRFINGGEFFD